MGCFPSISAIFFCSVMTQSSYFCFSSFPHTFKVRMLMFTSLALDTVLDLEQGSKGCDPTPDSQGSFSPQAVAGSSMCFLRRERCQTSSIWDYLFLKAFKLTGATFCPYRVPWLSKWQHSRPGLCWLLAVCRRDCCAKKLEEG